jgi:flagellar motor switch protein FliN
MMNDDMLSQDEIDALLRGSADSIDDKQYIEEPPIEDYLSDIEQDALGEIGNISFGSSATALSTLLNQKVDITTPTVSVIKKEELVNEFPRPFVAIKVNYTSGFSGSNVLVIKSDDAAIIADLMLGGDGLNPQEMLGEIQLSAVQEAMNQMMGSAATSMSMVFNKKIDISPPSIDIMDLNLDGPSSIPGDDILVHVAFRLKIGDLIDSNIMQLLPLGFAVKLVSELINPDDSKETSVVNNRNNLNEENTYSLLGENMKQGHKNDREADQSYNNTNNGSFETQRDFQLKNEQQQQHIGGINQMPKGYQPTIQPAVFSSFDTAPQVDVETKNLDMLLDIPLQVTVELGRTRKTIKDILELSSGSIIELDKLAGEPVDILVNNKLVAKGEVVVIDENFGVRVTDIISQSDRIKKLR